MSATVTHRSTPPGVGAPLPVTLPAPEETCLDNGLRIVRVPRAGSASAVAHIILPGGTGVLEPARAGLAALTADMLDEGTESLSAMGIAAAVEDLGANLRTGSGWDANLLRLEVPARFLEAGLEILAEVALRPSFPAHELERVRRERLSRILQSGDDPNTLAGNAFVRVLFGPDDPYGRPILGTGASVAALDLAAVQEYYRRWYRPGAATLVLAGNVGDGSVASRIEDAFGGWSRSGDEVPAFAAEVSTRSNTAIFLVDRPGAPQSEVRVGRVGVDRRTGDFFPLAVLNTVLGGSFTSRLNAALREEKGYTYGAGSYFAMRRRPGPFVAQAAVHTPVTSAAVAEFLGQMDRLRHESVPEEELARARNYLAYRFPQRFESVSDLADRTGELVLHELPWTFWSDYVERAKAVSSDDVRRVAEKYLDPASMTVVVAGDRSVVEGPLRELKLGPVEVLDPEQE